MTKGANFSDWSWAYFWRQGLVGHSPLGDGVARLVQEGRSLNVGRISRPRARGKDGGGYVCWLSLPGYTSTQGQSELCSLNSEAAPRLDNAHIIEARPAMSMVIPIMNQFG